MEVISVKNLSVAYENNTIIEDLSLSIPKGKISIIIGANGCGKSTFLKTLARINKPKAGEIFINKKDIKDNTIEYRLKLNDVPNSKYYFTTIKESSYYNDEKEFASIFRNKFIKAFEELREKLDNSHEIAAVKNIKLESDTLKLRCMDEIIEYEEAEAHRPKSVQPVPPVTPETSSGHTEPLKPVTPPVQPKPKKRKNVSISNVAGARTYSIENEQDIDKFLAEMKKKLLNELDENTIITLS